MSVNKVILLFVVKIVVIFSILNIPQLKMDKVFDKYYIHFGNKFYHNFGSAGRVMFRQSDEADKLQVLVGNKKTFVANGENQIAWTKISTKISDFVPVSLLLALVWASPVNGKRKLIGTFMGIAFFTVIMLFKQWIIIMNICDQNAWLQLTLHSSFQSNLINSIYMRIIMPTGATLMIAVFIWLVVTFRRVDVERFLVKRMAIGKSLSEITN
jgi:hypothetical protein